MSVEGNREIVIRYHERTKHHVGRYARSLGFLDWDTQPNPFRTFDGSPRILLQEIEVGNRGDRPHFDEIVREGTIAPEPTRRESISQFLYDSLAISAWKGMDDHRWPLRCNPSSGNLHPTEGYVILPAMEEFLDSPGLYHYRALDHALEQRRVFPSEIFDRAMAGRPAGSFLVGLTSIHWREAWKYGERAFRYCQHDVGHAIAALSYAAGALGWRVRAVRDLGDDDLARLLAIDDQEGLEAEHPDILLLVEPSTASGESSTPKIDRGTIEAMATRPRLGARNTLSPSHVEWDAIDAVALASRRTAVSSSPAVAEPPHRSLPGPRRTISARTLFRQRRSAVAFDGKTGITREAFFAICERLMPRAGRVPFSTLVQPPGVAAIHPVFFVHRVADLPPGLYFLERREGAKESFRAHSRRQFTYARPEGCDVSLPLFELQRGDVKAGAQFVSCHQDIASDGAFAVAMLAEFEGRILDVGPHAYRELHFEAGAIGQSLYLEAEALGIRGTGIGCFFDDAAHELLGLRGRTFQTVYHFTVGFPVEDTRLQVFPAYGPRV